MSVEIVSPGALTTVQDYGRLGYQKSGISVSGVMDQSAYFRALELVGEPTSIREILEGKLPNAVLETTLIGPMLRFTEDTWFAITGADMNPELDGVKVSMNQTTQAKAGQMLTMGLAVNGCRSYIAFSGGIDVPVVMNSRSTNIKCSLGGFQGRALRPGDSLPVSSVPCEIKSLPCTPYPEEITLRVIEGPQDDYFTENAFHTLYSSSYTVSDLSDRMGYRLEGPALESKNGVDIISDGITFGSIQVPPNGKPIILLADRQTTGGYAKIATVCSEDLSGLVQLKPGGTVRFKKCQGDGSD